MLDELERLERAATPAPWGEFAESGDWWVEGEAPDGGPDGNFVCGTNTATTNGPWAKQDDIDLMIAARNALPALLRVARAAIVVREKRRAMWNDPRSADASAAASIALDRLDDAVAALAALEGQP